MGLGSVGREILCLREPVLVIAFGSALTEGIFEAEALRTNHAFGFERNWAKPDEGEAERGKPGEEGTAGARESLWGIRGVGCGAPLRRFMGVEVEERVVF